MIHKRQPGISSNMQRTTLNCIHGGGRGSHPSNTSSNSTTKTKKRKPPLTSTGTKSYSPSSTFKSVKRFNHSGDIVRSKVDILPTSGLIKNVGNKTQQRWPWQVRANRSQIFEGQSDSNDKVSPNDQMQPMHRVSWQNAQASAPVFFFGRVPPDPHNSIRFSTNNKEVVAASKSRRWPWEDRSMKSLIFNPPEGRQPGFSSRAYKWDQRVSNLFFQGDEQEPPKKVSGAAEASKKMWPWQKRAMESRIFKELLVKPYKGIYYPWDQRKSGIRIRDHEEDAHITCVSRYKQDFLKMSLDQVGSMIPAGKRCYGVLNSERSGKKVSEGIGKSHTDLWDKDQGKKGGDIYRRDKVVLADGEEEDKENVLVEVDAEKAAKLEEVREISRKIAELNMHRFSSE